MASDPAPPVVDDRTRADVLEQIERTAPYYTDAWDPAPGTGDVGRGVAELFSEMVADVVGRLNQVPEKHRVGFYDALGFARDPPQPARVPLSVSLADDAETNVVVPDGTTAVAPATESAPEQVFELPPGEGFEATPARLLRLYSVDPDDDEIFAHEGPLDGSEASQLWTGDPLQTHALHVGHSDLLDVAGGTTVHVQFTTSNVDTLRHLRWAYYEEREGDEDGPHWHAIDSVSLAVTSWATANAAGAPTTVLVGLTLPLSVAELTETTVGGVESRWIRCVLAPDAPDEAFEFDLSSVRIGPGPTTAKIDGLLATDVPLEVPSTEEPVYPFGRIPHPRDEFYVRCDEAFTKRETAIELHVTLTVPPPDDDHLESPSVSWQYWDGTRWAGIPNPSGFRTSGPTNTDVLNLRVPAPSESTTNPPTQATGYVRFTVPDELSSTTVAGQDGYWIRAQLQEGTFNQVTYQRGPEPLDPPVDDAELWTLVTQGVGAPSLTSLAVQYGGSGSRRSPDHLVSLNNLAHRVEPADESATVRPFSPLPDERQTLYFGFDAPLVDGPVHLLVSPTDREVPESVHPRLRWEYTVDGETWARASVDDGTDGLRRRGLVRLVFPTPSVERRRFGERRHWLRARVEGEQFDPDADDSQSGLSADEDATPAGVGFGDQATTGWCLEPCDDVRRLATLPPGGRPSRAPPNLVRVVPNVGWARNVHTVGDEGLGSSDGSPDQAFVVESPPLSSVAVWVDERRTLTADERAALAAAGHELEVVEGDGPEPAAVWVRWTRVPDFLASAATDRHFTVDPLAGRVAFGDDVHGAIPPAGTDNLRATYASGGGSGGNVPPDTVTELTSDVRSVDSVSNPEPGDGGADAESLAAVLDRAPKALRDRGRAVGTPDFERLALDASRKLARARCLPRMDDAGATRRGWVTVVVVPASDDPRPTLSAELRRQVESALDERVPATLLEPDRRLVVRGPNYVAVSVVARLTADAESISRVEEAAITAVRSFLHPLTGGTDGRGWQFGDLPCVSDVFALLEGVEGVDHVDDVALTYEGVGTADRVAVVEGEEPPTVTPDALASAGTHAIRVDPVDGSGGGP